SSRMRHTRSDRDWSSDVCSSDLDSRFLTAFPPQLDIVIWIPRAPRASEASAIARRLFDAAAKQNLHLALANLPVGFFDLKSAEKIGRASSRERVKIAEGDVAVKK